MDNPTIRFTIIYSPGKSWKNNQPWQEQGLYKHGLFMQTLYEKGILLYGGPFNDHTGGMAIVDVYNEKEVQEIIENDPAVQNQTFTAEYHPWTTTFDKPKGRNIKNV